jgi:DNA invertase Pin-like site-specific DNA recombinase
VALASQQPLTTVGDLAGERAWLYVRESTRAQGQKYGPAAQRERAERFAELFGMEIVRTFEDLRSGRSLARREEFARMLAELPASGVRVVVVAYASRWARDEFDGFATLKSLHDAAGCLVVADKALLSTEQSRFTELAREIVEAAHYSRELSRNIRDGIAEKLRIRHDVWSHPLLGFRRGGPHATIEPDPATMPTAVKAFELSAAGHSDQAIADQLGETLWRIRGALRSSLYAGRLPDGRPAVFPPPVDTEIWEQAQAARLRRSASGHHPRHRTYPLSDRGPLVCDECGRPLKGRARYKRTGVLRFYRHEDGCSAWPSAEVRAEQLEEQVGQLLDGARPNRETVARITAAVKNAPRSDPARRAQIQRQLRAHALELVEPGGRPRDQVLIDIDRLQRERDAVPAMAQGPDQEVSAEEALDYLNDLGRLWRETSDEGRRAMALAVFSQLGATQVGHRSLHDPRRPAQGRIVSVAVTDYAERRGLVLALPSRIEVVVVGDTGLEPVTSCMSPIRPCT